MPSKFNFRHGKLKKSSLKHHQHQQEQLTEDNQHQQIEVIEQLGNSLDNKAVRSRSTGGRKKRSLIRLRKHFRKNGVMSTMNQTITPNSQQQQQQQTGTLASSSSSSALLNSQQQQSAITLAPIINTQQLTSLALNSLQSSMSQNNTNSTTTTTTTTTNYNLNSNISNNSNTSTNINNQNITSSNNHNNNLVNNLSQMQIANTTPATNLQLLATANNSTQQNSSQLPIPSLLNTSISSNALANSSTQSQTNNSGTMSGYLSKWTNYIKGYQKRWFNLSNGLLSYYRSQTEMAHSCRGTINLANAMINSEDACHFVVSNGGTQVFHLKAASEMEKQKWVAALELAKNRAKQDNPDSDEETNTEAEKNEVQTMLKTLQVKLEDLNTCHDLVQKHSGALTKSLIDLEGLQTKPDESTLKTINERATLFKITLLAMINACQEFTILANTQGKKMQKVLQSEHDMRIKLEEMVQEMAKQQSNFESQISKRSKRDRKDATLTSNQTNNQVSNSLLKIEGAADDKQLVTKDLLQVQSNSQQQQHQQQQQTQETHTFTKDTLFNLHEDDDYENTNNNDDEFHDALDEVCVFPVTMPKANTKLTHKRNTSNLSKLSCQESDVSTDDEEQQNKATTIQVTMHSSKDQQQPQQQQQQQLVVSKKTNETQQIQLKPRERRKQIPPRPNYSLNLWGIMKNCIGKDLSKIPIPVNFSEPISMLQRLIEELEYSDLLDRAAMCEDQWEQMAYIAAFTISAYSTTATRTNKPFNPILGETYECDRFDELGWGWRAIAEQVSHHPPGFSVHCESVKDWTLYQEFTMSSKFRGQYLQVVPLGTSHLEFKKSGHHYTWRKITTFVRNIIVGKLWIDNVGEMDIINHKTKDVCHLKYFPYSYFSREPPRKVTGIITDSNNVARYVLNGTWTEQIEGAPVLNPQVVTEQTQLNTGASKVLWKRKYPPAYLETMYNFTELAVQLNEPEEGVAPTDSRNRPDQRLMEQGLWDDANKEKVRLEEKQRTIRKQRELLNEQLASENKPQIQYEPLWFKKATDPYTNQPIHVFKQEYWDCKKKHDWKRCPDLF